MDVLTTARLETEVDQHGVSRAYILGYYERAHQI